MKEMIELIGMQAVELLKDDWVNERLDQLQTEEEKKLWLAVASVYALAKANNLKPGK